jgi:hypothetical protein
MQLFADPKNKPPWQPPLNRLFSVLPKADHFGNSPARKVAVFCEKRTSNAVGAFGHGFAHD